jgi:hypothetical protein
VCFWNYKQRRHIIIDLWNRINEIWFLDQQWLMLRAVDLQSIFRWHFFLYFNKFLLMYRAVDLQNVDVQNIDLRPVDL